MPETKPVFIHTIGILLFLFIPLVLALFLRFPWGIFPSFAAAIAIMFSHRFVAIPFMNRFREKRCLWCGRTGRPRDPQTVSAGAPLEFQLCKNDCGPAARRFFDFCWTHKDLLRAGIFLPLLWYVLTMLLSELGIFSVPVDWNRFIFQFVIACTVALISIFHYRGVDSQVSAFAFPIHNLFLLGIRNTLFVFRVVGFWWIAASLWFLYTKM